MWAKQNINLCLSVSEFCHYVLGSSNGDGQSLPRTSRDQCLHLHSSSQRWAALSRMVTSSHCKEASAGLCHERSPSGLANELVPRKLWGKADFHWGHTPLLPTVAWPWRAGHALEHVHKGHECSNMMGLLHGGQQTDWWLWASFMRHRRCLLLPRLAKQVWAEIPAFSPMSRPLISITCA